VCESTRKWLRERWVTSLIVQANDTCQQKQLTPSDSPGQQIDDDKNRNAQTNCEYRATYHYLSAIKLNN
jgi:hypothetical protein